MNGGCDLRYNRFVSSAMPRRFSRALIPLFAFCIAIGTSASAQVALDLAGHTIDPLATNKITVLIFVRSDCPISNRYAPEIQSLAKEFQGDAAFYLVYPDRKETAQSIAKHLSDYGYALPALRDVHHNLARKSAATITPEAAVFRGTALRYSGRIDDRAVDFGSFRASAREHDLEDAIHAVISGQPVKKAGGPPVGCYISDLE
jgi:thiol-disulfide isomerase/thioredoxin